MEISLKGILIGIFCAILAVFGLVGAFGSWHIVPPGHRGVVVTMGTVSPVFKGEGFTGKLPMATTIYDVEIKQKTATGSAECFSSDLQNVTIEYSVMYRIPEAKVVTLFRGYSGDPLNALIAPRLYESLKQVTALHRAEELVKSRDQVKMAVLDNLKKAVGDLMYIDDITINNLKLSHDLEQAIEQKTVREQEALAKEFELQKANKQAEITVVEAEAEAKSVKIKGEALKNSPDVINLEIAKKWDGHSPTTVVLGDKNNSNFILPIK